MKVNKMLSTTVLALLLAGLLYLPLTIHPVKAQVTITIMPDGSINPSWAPISSVDNVTYTITGDVYAINVER
jgi:glycine/D-amino acid oxidase-like deaminating enzyme